jgi:hypothetical protein
MRDLTNNAVSRRNWLASVCCALALAACGGGSSNDEAPQATDNQLFAVDGASGTVYGFSTLTATAGQSMQGHVIGATIDGATRLVVDTARDELYVLGEKRITVYAQASKAGAQARPSRQIELPATALSPNDLKLDAVHDRLYVAVTAQYDEQVLVYDNASTVKGLATPSRTFTPGNGARAIALDVAGNSLYATGSTIGIARYDQIDTAVGQIFADGFLAHVVSGNSLEFDVARDRLYLADSFAGVQIVDKASALPSEPTSTLPITDITALALDKGRDRLYVGARNAAYAIDAASKMTGGTQMPASAVQAASGVLITGFAFR